MRPGLARLRTAEDPPFLKRTVLARLPDYLFAFDAVMEFVCGVHHAFLVLAIWVDLFLFAGALAVSLFSAPSGFDTKEYPLP